MKTLQELFEMYPAEYIEDEEIEWGSPVGGEIKKRPFIFIEQLPADKLDEVIEIVVSTILRSD